MMDDFTKSDMLDLLKKRRSIRKFKAKAVEAEKVNRLIKSALLAPSSRSRKPWEFIVVEDRETLEKLSKSRSGRNLEHVRQAALGIVVVADTDKSDVWIEDASIASTLIQLEAESLGLGSCWIQMRSRMYDEKLSTEQYVREVFGIPENYSVENMIVIGYPDEAKEPYTEEELEYGKVHREKFEKRNG